MASCTAVVVTYNSARTIERCLSALTAQVDDVIVVDNGSKDNTTGIIAQQFPKIALIRADANVGYGAAINKAAETSQSEFILELNADAFLEPTAVKEMMELMEAHSACGVVGPTILNADGSRYTSPRVFPSTADAMGHAFAGLVSQDNRWSRRYLRSNEEFSEPSAVDWVSGSCMLIRSQAFKELRGFDERYFMYMEDVDLCRRAHDSGWQVWFQPAAQVVHLQGASVASRPIRSIISHHRSLMRYTTSSARGIDLVLLPLVWAGIGFRMVILVARTALNRPQTHEHS